VRCEEFESRLNEILDRRRNPQSDAELWLHATSCPDCGVLLAGYRALFAGFKRREAVAAPEALAARVQLQLGRNRDRRNVGRDRAPLALVAAALVAAAILPGVWNSLRPTPAAAPEKSTLATTVRGGHPAAATAPSNAPLTVLARMAGDRVRFLAVHSEQSAVLAWRLVPSVGDVIEGIEGSAGAGRPPAQPGPNNGDKSRNPPGVDGPSAASGLPSASG